MPEIVGFNTAVFHLETSNNFFFLNITWTTYSYERW